MGVHFNPSFGFNKQMELLEGDWNKLEITDKGLEIVRENGRPKQNPQAIAKYAIQVLRFGVSNGHFYDSYSRKGVASAHQDLIRVAQKCQGIFVLNFQDSEEFMNVTTTFIVEAENTTNWKGTPIVERQSWDLARLLELGDENDLRKVIRSVKHSDEIKEYAILQLLKMGKTINRDDIIHVLRMIDTRELNYVTLKLVGKYKSLLAHPEITKAFIEKWNNDDKVRIIKRKQLKILVPILKDATFPQLVSVNGIFPILFNKKWNLLRSETAGLEASTPLVQAMTACGWKRRARAQNSSTDAIDFFSAILSFLSLVEKLLQFNKITQEEAELVQEHMNRMMLRYQLSFVGLFKTALSKREVQRKVQAGIASEDLLGNPLLKKQGHDVSFSTEEIESWGLDEILEFPADVGRELFYQDIYELSKDLENMEPTANDEMQKKLEDVFKKIEEIEKGSSPFRRAKGTDQVDSAFDIFDYLGEYDAEDIKGLSGYYYYCKQNRSEEMKKTEKELDGFVGKWQSKGAFSNLRTADLKSILLEQETWARIEKAAHEKYESYLTTQAGHWAMWGVKSAASYAYGFVSASSSSSATTSSLKATKFIDALRGKGYSLPEREGNTTVVVNGKKYALSLKKYSGGQVEDTEDTETVTWLGNNQESIAYNYRDENRFVVQYMNGTKSIVWEVQYEEVK